MPKTVDRIKTVCEFLTDAVKALKDNPLVEAVEKALPWAGFVGEAAVEALPPVRFALKLFEQAHYGNDPHKLGHLAVTMAYQRAAHQAVLGMDRPHTASPGVDVEAIAKKLDAFDTGEKHDFKTFSKTEPFSHPLLQQADKALSAFAERMGFDEDETRLLVLQTHLEFTVQFRWVLSERSLAKHFDPFTRFLQLDDGEYRAMEALLQHAHLQRRLFEQAPLFNMEPFSLAQIYIDTECGKLTWGEIRPDRDAMGKREVLDPFEEKNGGRHGLIQTVMGLMGDKKFNDAIVIQGAAGTGKSSFTLKLCAELLRKGLVPLRVRMRDLRSDAVSLFEDLEQALTLRDEVFKDDQPIILRPDNMLRKGRVFNDLTDFGGTQISRYVLILDGWDEIKIGGSMGLQKRMEHLLERIRNELLRRDRPVRVILTGRPSEALHQSSFLEQKTPILTLRPIKPKQLESLVEKLRLGLALKRYPSDQWEPWSLTDAEKFTDVFQAYADEFEAYKEDNDHKRKTEVLGLPLLAFLAIRMMAERQDELKALIEIPSDLYRHLVDMTCRGGKAFQDKKITRAPHIHGHELRALLRGTAAAMYVHGRESIEYEELEARLEKLLPCNDGRESLLQLVKNQTDDVPLVNLMVSYFFKTGNRELGCEFLHKSFKEYLFAEAIVECLKSYGSQEPTPPQHEDYRLDFSERDPRRQWSRDLAFLLGPQWLSREVWGHVEALLQWEIERSWSPPEQDEKGHPTASISETGWHSIRDGLAALWAWWGEGAHMRLQPPQSRKSNSEEALVDEWVFWCKPQAVDRWSEPFPRSITVDGHLGEAICQLSAMTHFYTARASGWLKGKDGKIPTPEVLWEEVAKPKSLMYQVQVSRGEQQWLLFQPGNGHEDYFANYIARINAAGFRPAGPFPSEAFLQGVHAAKANLPGIQGYRCRFSFSFADQVNIMGARLDNARLDNARLDHARLDHARLYNARLDNARLDNAILDYAILDNARLYNARLYNARLYSARLYNARLYNARLYNARFSGAFIRNCSFASTLLKRANFGKAVLSIVDFTGSDVTHEQLAQAVVTEYLKGLPFEF